MNKLKFLFSNLVLFFFSVTLVSAQQFIDNNTPVNALPIGERNDCNWRLDFSDEFNDNEIDLTKWTINNSTKSRAARPKIKISDWWWKPQNVSEKNGNLVLDVVKKDFNTMHCGSINSARKYETQYGYFECRIKVGDIKKGTHSAFWLQGKNQGNIDGTANDGCEIDIFESAFDKPNAITKSVFHRDGYGKYHEALTKQYNTPNLFDGFHTFGMYWDENIISMYYDGELKTSYTRQDRKYKTINGVLTDIDGKDGTWLVHTPEYLWVSNGASFGVTGDQYFVNQPEGLLTQTYVDYVRVWKGSASPFIVEAENINLNKSNTAIKVETINKQNISSGAHHKISFTQPGDFVEFNSVNIPVTGYYNLKFEGLTWVNFGKIQWSIKSENQEWQTSNVITDGYKNTSVLKPGEIGPFFLEKGISKIRVVCVGKNKNSSGYVASLDKLEYVFVGQQECVQTNNICNLNSSNTSLITNCNSANIKPFVSFSSNLPAEIEEGYGELSFIANAFDTDGVVVKVDLKIDGNFIRSEQVGPYEWGQITQNITTKNELLNLSVGEHLFELTATDAKGAIAKTQQKLIVKKPVTLNLAEFSNLNNQIAIYPNPSPNGIYSLNKKMHFDLYSIEGKHIGSYFSNTINISKQKSGLYFVNFKGFKPLKIIRL